MSKSEAQIVDEVASTLALLSQKISEGTQKTALIEKDGFDVSFTKHRNEENFFDKPETQFLSDKNAIMTISIPEKWKNDQANGMIIFAISNVYSSLLNKSSKELGLTDKNYSKVESLTGVLKHFTRAAIGGDSLEDIEPVVNATAEKIEKMTGREAADLLTYAKFSKQQEAHVR